jgi:glucosylceramidase
MRNALTALAALSMIACAGRLRAPEVQVWVTTADQSRLLARDTDRSFGAGAPLALNIDVDAHRHYQEFLGVGAAFTDATALLFANNLAPGARAALLRELFGPAPGIGLSLMRVPIGASDFSAERYTFDDMPAGATDPTLAHFDLGPNGSRVLSLVRAAHEINPAMRLIGSTWSAPAWMKSSGSLLKGQLLPAHYGAYADYLLRFADSYRLAGVPLYGLTGQNEPGFEPTDYPGMRFEPADRARFIRENLGPGLASQAGAPLYFDYDHNWDVSESPLQVLDDPAAARYVAGVAWHCYGGEIGAQTLVHNAYPKYATLMTECSGGDWEHSWAEGLRWFVGTLLIEGGRHWGSGTILWNLALDEHHGPHLGGCGDCRGVVTINSITGAVTRNVEYYSLAHLGRFVRPGARRIESTSGLDGLQSVAYRNSDDGTVALLVFNGASGPRRFSLTVARGTLAYELPAGAAATFVW